MKKFVFSLEKVMSYKNQTLDIKKAELSQLQHQLTMLEKSIDELQQQYSEANLNLAEKLKEGMLSGDIALTKLFLNKLDQRIKALKYNRQQLLDIISLKKRDILEIRTAISGLERLKEKQTEEYRQAAQKEQELAIEEFVSHNSSVGTPTR